jgi:peptidoglycan/xylan/chitin deacetylase (PgdA/CDA1 family)
MKRRFTGTCHNVALEILGRTGFPRVKTRFFPRKYPLILGYHTIDPPEFLQRILGVRFSRTLFEGQIAYIAQHHEVISMPTLLDWLDGGEAVPPNGIVITFDDGYRDVFDSAMPVLNHWNLPATVFVSTGSVDTGRSIWTNKIYHMISETQKPTIRLSVPGTSDISGKLTTLEMKRAMAMKLTSRFKQLADSEKKECLNRLAEALDLDGSTDPFEHLPMLTSDQIKILSGNGFTIGSHTVSHPILSRCTEEEQRCELTESKRQIEVWTGEPCTVAAYPNGQPGDYTDTTKQIARELGYRGVFRFNRGPVSPGIDMFSIPRYPLLDVSLSCFTMHLALG